MTLFNEFKNISSTRKDLKSFGLTVGIALFIIYLIWRKQDFAVYVAIAGGILIILGLTVPIVLKPFQKVWMGLSIVLGFIMSHLILFILFYLVFVPLGVIGRLAGKEFIQLKLSNSKDSYWEKRKDHDDGLERYEKQY